MVSNTDFGVPEREEPPPSLGAVRGGSGNGRLFIGADPAAGIEGPARQAPRDLCEGVGEGGGNICKRVRCGVGFHLGFSHLVSAQNCFLGGRQKGLM